MDGLISQLLQLGFSFFVAGYLLVSQGRLIGELVKTVERLELHLTTIEGVLVRVEDLLQYLSKGGGTR